MEVPFIPQSTPQKVDSAKTQAVSSKKAANAYSATKSGAADAIQISSKSKLMQKLTASYNELDKADNTKAADYKKLQADDTLVKMSSADIVDGILKGSLFEVM